MIGPDDELSRNHLLESQVQRQCHCSIYIASGYVVVLSSHVRVLNREHTEVFTDAEKKETMCDDAGEIAGCP